MAKSATDTDLFRRLRDSGVRKGAARRITSAVAAGDKRSPKQVQAVTRELRALLAEVEDRATGGTKKKRKAAAKKATATRKRNEAKRSASARKAAETRRKNQAKAKMKKTRAKAKR